MDKDRVYKKEDFKISIDWKYVNKGGVRRVREKFEMVFGFSLGVTITFIVGLAFLFAIIDNVREGIELDFEFSNAFWGLAFLVLFSLFLLRDRDKYWDSMKHSSLDTLRKRFKKNIELSKYFDHDVLNVLDLSFEKFNEKKEIDSLEFMTVLFTFSEVRGVFDRFGIQKKAVLKHLKKEWNEQINIEDLLKESFVLSLNLGLEYLDERALLLALLEKYEMLVDIIARLGVYTDDIESYKAWLLTNSLIRRYKKIWEIKKVFKPSNRYTRGRTNITVAEIEDYSRDLTLLVRNEDNFTLSISREEEIDKIISFLGNTQTSVLLVGAPGVGKTTLLKSLAVRMVVEDVPVYLQDKRLLEFNFNKAYATSKNLSEYLSIFDKVINGLEKAKNVVLVLDNFEQLLNTKKELSSQIANFVITATENKNVKLIATTTGEGYEKYIRQNEALNRIFSKVEMKSPSKGVARQIILDEVLAIERDKAVKITFGAVSKAIELSDKYSSDRVMPDKALVLVREAASEVRKDKKRKIDSIDISNLVSGKIGVKVGVLGLEEKDRLKNLEKEMHKRVVGQDKAVNAVASALRRERYGIRDEKKPIASFLFAGPTGVGKTEVARTLARIWFGGEDSIIRLDMSEYQEAHNLNRLIGFRTDSGEFEEGYLTGKVKHRPFSLILIDELEKANSKVLDLFLQILDEGRVKDALNRDINFKSCVIIATSNTGSALIAKRAGEMKFEEVEKLVMEELKKEFRIEFLNRFDDIIVFKPLTRDDFRKIALIILNLKANELKKKGIKIEITNELINKIVDEGYSPIWGARELKREIDREIENIVINGGS